MSRKQAAIPPRLDARARRSRDRLGDALVALVQEKAFDAITVQDVLDRAGVSRSTFYTHFRDKDDLFLSDADEFFELMAMRLVRGADSSERVAPLHEMLVHVAEVQAFQAALVAAGKWPELMELARAHFARGIERRLEQLPRAQGLRADDRATLGTAYAAAFVALLTRWLRTSEREPPAQLDALFQRLVWSGVDAASRG